APVRHDRLQRAVGRAVHPRRRRRAHRPGGGVGRAGVIFCAVASARGMDSVSAMTRFLFSLVVAALGALFTGCSTVPETGRSQGMLISPAMETRMGLESFSQIKQEEKVSADPVVNARIQRIGARIAASVGRELPDAK